MQDLPVRVFITHSCHLSVFPFFSATEVNKLETDYNNIKKQNHCNTESKRELLVACCGPAESADIDTSRVELRN